MSGGRPLVVHVVYRFDTGGLENGVVNLIDRMRDWRHAVVALTEAVPSFCERVQRDDVRFVSLHKPPGHGVRLYPRLYRLFRELAPAIVHTRNLAALEAVVPAWAAGVAARVHGEHGRDAEDPHGESRRHQRIRRVYRPFVSRYIALSRDLAGYLHDKVGVTEDRIRQIYNGVDTERFAPAAARRPIAGSPFDDPALCLIGTVGRMQTVKAQPLLARAFVEALAAHPDLRNRLRLVMVGDGPLRAECEAVLRDAGVRGLAWFAGERADVSDIMRGLDIFALPSLAEGISNTILEAMASALPVLATGVGGNADLVRESETGFVVPPGDVEALARGISVLATAPLRARAMGHAGRERVLQHFSLDAMVAAYERTYRELLARPA